MTDASGMGVKTSDMVRDELRVLYKTQGLSWRAIARLEPFCSNEVKPGSLCSFYKGWEPKTNKIRAKFGLSMRSSVVPVQAFIPEGAQALFALCCPKCGKSFIPNHPRRVLCFICSPYAGKPKGKSDEPKSQ